MRTKAKLQAHRRSLRGEKRRRRRKNPMGWVHATPPWTAALDPDQERMLREIVLVAENEGSAYPSAEKAVSKAIRDHLKRMREQLKHDAEVIKDVAIAELRSQGGWM